MTSDFYIPTTVSKEAQDILKTFNREMRDNNITPKAKWQTVINEVITAIKGIYKRFSANINSRWYKRNSSEQFCQTLPKNGSGRC